MRVESQQQAQSRGMFKVPQTALQGCGANGSDGLLKCSINDKAKETDGERVLALKSSDSNKNSLPLSHSSALSLCLDSATTQHKMDKRGDMKLNICF